LAEDLIAHFGPLPNTSPSDAAIWLLAGLITVADWIGSDESHFPQDAAWDLPERHRRAQIALTDINWRPVNARPALEFYDLFPEITEPNSLQRATLDSVRGPGIYVIEGPMGCGKTEAALAAAYKLIAAGAATGLYFALPTQTTSNRIHDRVQAFVNEISREAATVRLAHGASWLADGMPLPDVQPASDEEGSKDHAEDARSWFASAKRALLVPFGVGTVDQALLGIVAAKHFFLRQFGLAGKVVILDEVHTYDMYTGTLISQLVKRLRELHCTVLILSATLIEQRRRELLEAPETQPLSRAYPVVSGVAPSLIECACERPPSKTVQIRCVSRDLPVDQVLEHARRGVCVLWIRNTVDEAQATYRALRDSTVSDDPPTALLHSRFPFFRRDELETDWMDRLGKNPAKRPAGCVLVSTQVAEQSVDIDADLLITDLAPTDILLQRLGRLWRHDRLSRPCLGPEVWIHMPDGDDAAALGKSARVYAPYILLRSLDQWRHRTSISLPEDIRAILEKTYAEPSEDEPQAWRELHEHLEKQKESLARKALNATTVWVTPDLPDDEGTQTRYSTYKSAQLLLAHEITSLDNHSVRLRLLNGDSVTASSRKWDLSAAKAIHRNLTRVPLWAVLPGRCDSAGWLKKHVAQAAAAGLLQPDGSIRWLNAERDSGLSYDPDEGVIISRAHDYEGMNESYD
jgi:CRISPR-associated endonuclease/helicase Cas3